MRALGLWVGLVLALAAPPAAGQSGSEPELRAWLSSGVVKLGDKVTLAIRIDDADKASVVSVPEVPGLAIGRPQGPNVNRTDSWINGRRTVSTQHVFAIAIQPLDTGEYELPPVELRVDGRQRSTPPLALTVVEDLQGAELGLFEVQTSMPRVVEGQPFTIELVFGVDAALAPRINYVNFSLPWWGQMPGVLELEEPDAGAARGSGQPFEINSSESVTLDRLPDRQVGGRDFIIFRLTRSYLPTRVGTLEFPTSFVEFGEVVTRRDFFNSRREKVETWYVRAPDLALEVGPLPEEGRPRDFGGALGGIQAEASADPRDVDAGDSIKLTVEWTGEGNLEFFQPPDLDRLEAFGDFRVYGMIDEVKQMDRRRVTYDLAPLTSEVTEIPPVPLPVFDPERGEYSVVETRALAVRVRALENPVDLGLEDERERFERDVHDIVARPGPPRPGGGPGAVAVFAALALTPGLWLALRAFGRRAGDPDAPLERRRRRARRELARGLAGARDAKDELDLLNAFLAARTREREQAWLGRAERVDELGVEPAAADGLRALASDLECGAFGGGESAGRERILRVADRLLKGGL